MDVGWSQAAHGRLRCLIRRVARELKTNTADSRRSTTSQQTRAEQSSSRESRQNRETQIEGMLEALQGRREKMEADVRSHQVPMVLDDEEESDDEGAEDARPIYNAFLGTRGDEGIVTLTN